MTARTHPNRVVQQDARMRASRQRNFSSNRDFRARNNAAVNRERNSQLIGQETSTLIVIRNATEFRARNELATNRNRNVAINRTKNFEV